jgi:ribonuclease HII
MAMPSQRERDRVAPTTVFEEAAHAQGYRWVAGLDEVGRGTLAGPVVAAAVLFEPGTVIAGLRDSKQLSPTRRDRLYPIILKEAAAVAVGMVDAEVIDRVNVLQATRLAMQRAIEQLKVQPDYLLLDAITLPLVPIPQRPIIKGDELSISIAAASIVAKVTRDRVMSRYHEEYPEYNFLAHKGYGTVEHRRQIRDHGPCQIHRKTFRGVCDVHQLFP